MDFVLKQRLVGAVVLVALAVIFIPMLLEGPDRNLVPEMAPLPEPADPGISQPLESFPQAGDIPDEPALSVVQADASAAGEGAEATGDRSADEATPLPVPDLSDSATETAPADDQPEVEPPEAVAGTPQSPPPTTSAAEAQDSKTPAALGSWVVQMGSFSSEQNALRLRDRLRKEHFATQVEKVVVGGKTLYRVRVGPYLERAEAEADQKKLAATFDLKGRVLSYP